MIYIVEDDASIRELEQYALQSNGYEVQGFESAEPTRRRGSSYAVFCLKKKTKRTDNVLV